MIRGKVTSGRWCLSVIFLCSVFPLASQERKADEPAKSGVKCEEQANAIASGDYVYAVMDGIRPPDLRMGISVSVQFNFGRRVILYSNGEKYYLWLGITGVPGENIWSFLRDVAESCRLPADPGEAEKLLRIHWEVRELQRAQFEQLHRDFLNAFTQYTSTVKERSAYSMSTGLFAVPVDASGFTIIYDNSWEHFKIEELSLTDGQKTPLVNWVEELRSYAQQTFHTNPERAPEPTSK